MMDRIITGDALTVLKGMESESVHCVITSPPYYGLRSYGTEPQIWGGDPSCIHDWQGYLQPAANGIIHDGGMSGETLSSNAATRKPKRSDFCLLCGAWRGELGLEPTPELYVEHITQIFREARRVLKSDGVMFLNLGDSYFGGVPGSGGKSKKQITNVGSFFDAANVRRVKSCGTSDKAQSNYQAHDCLCGNLCDVCRVVYRNDKSRNGALLVAMLTASLSAPNREHKELRSGHLPTLDSFLSEDRNVNAIDGFGNFPDHANGRLRASLVSMLGESYPQLLDECLQRANRDECLLCARTLGDCVRECADKTVCTCGKSQRELVDRKQNKDVLGLAYPHSTTTSLKSKDLIGIPWRVAFALQADGWYLRQDIIWHKPNPMPESVTDRCTKAHEYIFLLSKSARYYYDQEAVREPFAEVTLNDARSGNPEYEPKRNRLVGGQPAQRVGLLPTDKNGRNLRSVWTIATQPYSEAHFATFPEKLIEPCIKAGCPEKVCPACGKPWERIIKRIDHGHNGSVYGQRAIEATGGIMSGGTDRSTLGSSNGKLTGKYESLGFSPTCSCNRPDTIPGTVLDPFIGSGTTMRVALRLNRQCIGIDLGYQEIQKKRTSNIQVELPL